jgi:hypothetical protein
MMMEQTKRIDLAQLEGDGAAEDLARVLEVAETGRASALWTTQFAASGKAGKQVP